MHINKKIKEWIESILLSVIIVGILFFIFWPFEIEGPSMENSFLDGDRIAVSRILISKVERGDFIVCKLEGPEKEQNIIKRIIGMPGDTVQIKDGEVSINKVILEEDYIGSTLTDGNIDLQLGTDEFFVMGDNRESSYDSRLAGPIKAKKLIGKVVARWYPINRMKLFS